MMFPIVCIIKDCLFCVDGHCTSEPHNIEPNHARCVKFTTISEVTHMVYRQRDRMLRRSDMPK